MVTKEKKIAHNSSWRDGKKKNVRLRKAYKNKFTRETSQNDCVSIRRFVKLSDIRQMRNNKEMREVMADEMRRAGNSSILIMPFRRWGRQKLVIKFLKTDYWAFLKRRRKRKEAADGGD